MNTILIVDDNTTNLEVISGALAHSDYEILFALDGESAIEQAEYAQPDLILLDVMMPGIDGFETCHRLKENTVTSDIPVILMTALSDILDKVRGFNVGAVDYITKPFQQEEVLVRIHTHLKIRNLTQQLTSQNLLLLEEVRNRICAEASLAELVNHLEERVAERTSELVGVNQQLQDSEAELRSRSQQLEKSLNSLHHTQQVMLSEKMSSLGQLVAGIAHEINNPINFIYGNLSYTDEYVQQLLQLIQLYKKYSPSSIPEIESFLELTEIDFLESDLQHILNSMKLGVDRVKEIVISLRNFSHLDEADLKLVDIHKGIDNTLMLLKHRCYRSELGLKIEVIKEYGNLPLVECYPGQLNQVLINILSNAIDALEADFAERSPSDNYQIRISTKLVDSEKISISIADNGLGIPEAVQQHIFDPFFTTKTVGKGKGMGLAISYQIITEKHQGSLECLSQISRGSEFVITIPIAQKQISIIPRNTASMTSASLSNQTIG